MLQKHVSSCRLMVGVLVMGAALYCAPTVHAQTSQVRLYERNAQGDITQLGGARRTGADVSDALKNEITGRPARNVILLIGDGMGESELTIARNYALGAGGYFKGMDSLPFVGHITHYSLNKETRKPDYVTDSAASGTAWATGVKSYNGAIGVDVYGKAWPNLIELARQAGKATGNVSTAEIQDATPAVLIAHVTARKCYGPEATSKLCPNEALENGGLGSITEQLLNTRPDVTLGGGNKVFAEIAKAGEWQGMTLTEQAQKRGYQIVYNLDELEAVQIAHQDKPLLGLFAAGNMPVRWQGPKATYQGNLKQESIQCTENTQRADDVPTLAAMTHKAIELLNQNEKGFFLQVEGASIDKQDHAANPCGQIGETVDLDEAVQVALEFARNDGNTLVIVTADHAHTSQIIPNGATAPGLTQTLITQDGSPMTISYGTNEQDDQEHTGAQIRVAAYGPYAANITGLIDQTDLFYIIKNALSLK